MLQLLTGKIERLLKIRTCQKNATVKNVRLQRAVDC